MTKVKICGITSAEEALAAAEAGADAVGLVFAPGRRRLTPSEARVITAVLPPFVARVGVFADEKRETVKKIARICGLTALQFHGDESAQNCRGYGLPLLKALRVRNSSDLTGIADFPAAAYVLDSYDPALLGGSGKTFDWSLIPDNLVKPVILAGGLNSENVRSAILLVRPYAVDVSSGVEVNGKKDKKKMLEFINAVKGDISCV